MARCALIYEAYVLHAEGLMNVAGLTYGVIDGKEFDGELRQACNLRKAWVDNMGIGVKDIQGHEYMILSLDDRSGVLFDVMHNLFALSFLHDKPASVEALGAES